MGKNSYVKTHRIQAEYAEKAGLEHKIYLHAEIDAIIKLKHSDLDRAHRIFIFRHHSDGTPAKAKPCPICLYAIQQTKIKVIDHT